MSNNHNTQLFLTILMPCLNEEETLGTCIKKAQKFLKKQKYKGEVLIADNGSTDNSKKIAVKEGARVIEVKEKGYGSALMAGIKASKGKYIVMGDADDSYDFTALDTFVQKLEEGYELVMGNRFKGGIKKGAMPPLHKYLGNPVLSGIGKLFFKAPIGDFHSGLRAFKRDSILELDLQTTGMEYASEMVVKATLFKLKMTEVPIVLYPDGRSRKPHLRSWRDGWRHLRFLLLFSPKWLFLFPGIALSLVGLMGLVTISISDIHIGQVTLSINTMMFCTLFLLLGFNLIILNIYTNIFGVKGKILPTSNFIKKFFDNNFLEKGILVGLLFVILGSLGSFFSFFTWYRAGFKELDLVQTIRIIIPAITLFIVGIQIIFSSFFISILMLPVKTNYEKII